MKKEIERFRAISDDGTEHTVIRYRLDIWFTPVSGKRQLVRSVASFELYGDEREVGMVDSETFKIVETDQIIRKVR